MVKINTGIINSTVQHNTIICYINCYFKVRLHSKYMLERNMYIGEGWSSLSNDTWWYWEPLGFRRGVLYG